MNKCCATLFSNPHIDKNTFNRQKNQLIYSHKLFVLLFVNKCRIL